MYRSIQTAKRTLCYRGIHRFSFDLREYYAVPNRCIYLPRSWSSNPVNQRKDLLDLNRRQGAPSCVVVKRLHSTTVIPLRPCPR